MDDSKEDGCVTPRKQIVNEDIKKVKTTKTLFCQYIEKNYIFTSTF